MAEQRAKPARVGVGFRPEHAPAIFAAPAQVDFFEIHAENYMGAGGPPLARLERLRRDHDVSVHGVALSIGGPDALDRDHLARLRRLVERCAPTLVSEHLAWSRDGGRFLNDLLPIPLTDATLARVCDHVDAVQETLGHAILIENPATYVLFEESTWTESDFLAALAARSGCGLLLDVNNLYVSAINHRVDPNAALKAFPIQRVAQMHLAGFRAETDADGGPLLIDAHCAAPDAAVWRLYEAALARGAEGATLIEWDNDVPPWETLLLEAQRAREALRRNAPAPERESVDDAA